MNNQEEFSFAIGRPWYPDKPDSPICVYTYGSEVHYGNAEEAEDFRKTIQQRAGDDEEYYVYKLVKV